MNLITIKTYDQRPEAELAKNLLAEHGIIAIIEGDLMNEYVGMGPAFSGFKLTVAEKDAEKARELLI